MSRQIVLDTETTGIRLEDGHRIIEIGCVELVDRKFTGSHFHHYLNPERDIELGALAVHGITNEFLKDKPSFTYIAKDFIDFISSAELIIHNAAFDTAFINYELTQTKQGWKALSDYCRIIDTLQIARQRHAGQRNSLDALCKRYNVDNSHRDLHGALLDAHLLAHVYLAMTGGQGSFFDVLIDGQTLSNRKMDKHNSLRDTYNQLTILKADENELSAHANYLAFLKENGKCVWSDEE